MKNLPIALLVFIIFSALILLDNSFAPVKFITDGVQSIFSGPKSAAHNLKTISKDVENQIKKENLELSKKMIDYDRLKRDNIALRSQFDSAETSSYTLMPARVLGFTGNSQKPTSILLDHGSKNNIQKGMAVIVKNNLIGKISDVSSSYSKVDLTTNSKFKTLAKTSDTAAAGVVKGNEDFILFDRVSVNDTINKNSHLLTSGDVNADGIGVPPDLVIGKIISVNRSSNLPFQTGKVEAPLDFGKLEMVFIVEKY